jgi:dipeptidyl aminopeptidase/acylaminoacyl peptidase
MTGSEAGLIPRQALFAEPTIQKVSLSPDGKTLAWIRNTAGLPQIWAAPVDDMSAGRLVPGTGAVTSFVWTYDKRLVCLNDRDGDEQWALTCVDPQSGAATVYRPPPGARVTVIGGSVQHPDDVLITINAREPAMPDVYRLSLSTGEAHLLRRNPGFARWHASGSLMVAAATKLEQDGTLTVYLAERNDSFAPVWTVSPDDAAATRVCGTSTDGSTIWLLSPADSATTRLLRLDSDTRAPVPVASHPVYDIVDVWLSVRTGAPMAARVAGDRHTIVALGTSTRRHLADLERLCPGDLWVLGTDRSELRWLLAWTDPDCRLRYCLYRPSAARMDPLLAPRPQLQDRQLALMEPFRYRARDGLPVSGYLTFPRGSIRRRLPTVIAVHGGPWARDTWGFNPYAQWFADRGYLCVQPNMRGSTGYGKSFQNAGDRQWGGAIIHDLVDAARHVVAMGFADPTRIAISGASFGGYAALTAATFEPDVFRCAVALAAPVDLASLVRSIPAHWRSTYGMFIRRIGDPERDAELLAAHSPLTHVGRLRVPVLIAHGDNDPRVSRRDIDRYLLCLTTTGVEHEFIAFPDEGHGLRHHANLLKFLAAAERFLATHIGGRAELE